MSEFYGTFSILMCVKCFKIVCLKTGDTGASSWLFTFVSCQYQFETLSFIVYL